MPKSSGQKKTISFTLGNDEYIKLIRYAEQEDRKIASAVRIIILKHLRNSK